MRYSKENPVILKRYDKIFFGKKYKGKVVGDLLKTNPKYLIWLVENAEWIKFQDDVLKELEGQYHTITPKEIFTEVVERFPRTMNMLSNDAAYDRMQEQYNNYWKDRTDFSAKESMEQQYRNYHKESKPTLLTCLKNIFYGN